MMNMEGVEIDQRITDLAREYFELPDIIFVPLPMRAAARTKASPAPRPEPMQSAKEYAAELLIYGTAFSALASIQYHL